MAILLSASYIHLGFSNAAGASLIAQGFAAPEDLEHIKKIVGLCKSWRLPGGLIPNPVEITNAGGQLPVGILLLIASNHGETVGAMAEQSLKQVIQFVRHHIHISRPLYTRYCCPSKCLLFVPAQS